MRDDARIAVDLAAQRLRAPHGRCGRTGDGRRCAGRRENGEEPEHGDGQARAHRPVVVAGARAPGYPSWRDAEERRRFQSIIQTDPRFTQRNGRRAAGGVASAR